MASNAENVSIWWRHHVINYLNVNGSAHTPLARGEGYFSLGHKLRTFIWLIYILCVRWNGKCFCLETQRVLTQTPNMHTWASWLAIALLPNPDIGKGTFTKFLPQMPRSQVLRNEPSMAKMISEMSYPIFLSNCTDFMLIFLEYISNVSHLPLKNLCIHRILKKS